MWTLQIAVLGNIAGIVSGMLLWFIGLAVAFSLIRILASPCNDTRPWWRKPDLVVDLLYWFVGALFGSWITTALLIVGMVMLSGGGVADVSETIQNGRGPLSVLPFWAQVGAYLLLTDTFLYFSHRLYHSAGFWRFHAIHHASEHLEWLSASRFHPGNLVLGNSMANAVVILLGISPEVLILMAPFNIVTGAMVHANLDWTFGPFRYVFASPVFHRWHHTAADRGGSSNFASTFPFLDLAFGTYYMPANEKPDAFGVDDPDFPRDFWGQMLYPWKRKSGVRQPTLHEADTGLPR